MLSRVPRKEFFRVEKNSRSVSSGTRNESHDARDFWSRGRGFPVFLNPTRLVFSQSTALRPVPPCPPCADLCGGVRGSTVFPKRFRSFRSVSEVFPKTAQEPLCVTPATRRGNQPPIGEQGHREAARGLQRATVYQSGSPSFVPFVFHRASRAALSFSTPILRRRHPQDFV
jgi:hypothetical protein